MPAWAWVIVVVVIAAAVGLYVVRSSPRRRSQALREHFGPEYGRVVEEQGGDEKAAEAELAARQERRSTLDIRPLSDRSRREYGERWGRTQAMFVDSPQLAIAEADLLVQSVMRDRGYPVDDAEQRLADVSVDHPDVMDRFRLATAIAVEAREDRATTERLRQAMVHYRELFDRLLADEGDSDRRTA
jgi:hypothetical protein